MRYADTNKQDHVVNSLVIDIPDAPNNMRQVSMDLAAIIGHKDETLLTEKYGGINGVLHALEVIQEDTDTPFHKDRKGSTHVFSSYGIDAFSVWGRRELCGANKLMDKPRQSIWFFVVDSIQSDKTVQLLIVSALLSMILGVALGDSTHREKTSGWMEGFAIIVSIIIVTSVNAWNEYYKQDQFLFVRDSELRQESMVAVWRFHISEQGGRKSSSTERNDGNERKSDLQRSRSPHESIADRHQEVQRVCEGSESHTTLHSRGPPRMKANVEIIPSASLVVGDVMRITAGMRLTVDALLIRSNGPILVDEVSITGESDECVKEIGGDIFLISGSSILEGSGDGLAVVCAVGSGSFSGEISDSISCTMKEATPLQKQLGHLADLIAWLGFICAVSTLIILTVKDILFHFAFNGSFTISKFLSNIITAITIVVVAVPEGLPLSVTISLAYSMRRMIADGNLVRHLAACETMGGATVMCTDKTGTLTAPNMSVSQLVLGMRTYSIENERGTANTFDIPAPLNLIRLSWPPMWIQRFMDAIAWTAFNPETGAPINKTGEAILRMNTKFVSFDQGEAFTEDEFTVSASVKKVICSPPSSYRRYPINSRDKIGRTIVSDLRSTVQHNFLYGAADTVLKQCNRFITEDGAEMLFTQTTMKAHKEILDRISSSGLRVVCFAFTTTELLDRNPGGAINIGLEYCLLAMIGCQESLRFGVTESLQTCRNAGIRVIMVTGDAHLTAVNVAERCGFFTSNAPFTTLDGPEFRRLDDNTLRARYLPHLRVLSRASPLDKKRLLFLLGCNTNEVVAMTGDGTNDAPALKMADIGFAMASGSDTAKKAADIILLDNSFTGMVRAVMWGRGIKDNIRKFLQYQLTVNVGACLIAFFGALVNKENISPLKPVQLLWLNLIMDSLAALALATELPCESELLSRPPEKQSVGIITLPMLVSVVVQCVLQLSIQCWLFYFGSMFLRGADHYSLTIEAPIRISDVHICFLFNTFVWMQVFNFFNARLLDNRKSLFSGLRYSRMLMLVVSIISTVQVIVIQCGGELMMTVPLTSSEWIFSILFGMSSLPIGKASRWACSRVDDSHYLLWRWTRKFTHHL